MMHLGSMGYYVIFDPFISYGGLRAYNSLLRTGLLQPNDSLNNAGLLLLFDSLRETWVAVPS